MVFDFSDLGVSLLILFDSLTPFLNPIRRMSPTSVARNWFCVSCGNIFDLKPWKRYKDKRVSELRCTQCGSHSVHHSLESCKAIIQKKTTSEIREIVKNLKEDPCYYIRKELLNA